MKDHGRVTVSMLARRCCHGLRGSTSFLFFMVKTQRESAAAAAAAGPGRVVCAKELRRLRVAYTTLQALDRCSNRWKQVFFTQYCLYGQYSEPDFAGTALQNLIFRPCDPVTLVYLADFQMNRARQPRIAGKI